MKSIELKKIGLLTLGFIPFTIIGTLSHELGHIGIAEFFGFETKLHFAHMEWNGKDISGFHDIWIAAGGPIQTMLFGSIGLIGLIRRRKNRKTEKFKLAEWLLLFLGLFWSRQIFNLFHRLGAYILGADESPFGGDEAYLSEMAGLPNGFFPIITAFIGIDICMYLVFKILPQVERFNFIIAAFLGSFLGFTIWMHGLGPIILP